MKKLNDEVNSEGTEIDKESGLWVAPTRVIDNVPMQSGIEMEVANRSTSMECVPVLQSRCCAAPIIFVHDCGPLCTKCNLWTTTEHAE